MSRCVQSVFHASIAPKCIHPWQSTTEINATVALCLFRNQHLRAKLRVCKYELSAATQYKWEVDESEWSRLKEMRGHSKPVLWNNNTILRHNRLAPRRLSAQVIHPKTIIEFRSSLFSFSSSQLALNFAYDESKIAIPTHQATLADVDEWWWSNSVRFPPLHTHSYIWIVSYK